MAARGHVQDPNDRRLRPIYGVSPPPGAVLVLHSLPLEFPLAMAFTELLLTWKLEDGDGKSEDELDTIPASVLLQVVEFLGNFLWTTDMAACVKELIFHLLAELLRKIHSLEQKKNPAGLSSSIALQLNPCLAMLMALQSELHKSRPRFLSKAAPHPPPSDRRHGDASGQAS